MKCASISLITTLLTVAHCLEIITVTVGPDGNEFHPSQISAPSNTALRFLLPSRFISIVQSTFDQPCTPLPGGFNSGFYGGNLDPSVWDWNIENNTQPIWFFYQNALQPTPCDEGIVGVINSPSTSQYTEFRQIAKNANLYQSNSALLPLLPVCPTYSAILLASISDPAMFSFSPLPQLLPTSTVVPMTSTGDPATSSFSPLPQLLPTSSAISMTSTSDPGMSSQLLPQLLSTSGAISMAFTDDPAMSSSFSPLPQVSPTLSAIQISTSDPAMSSLQLLSTSGAISIASTSDPATSSSSSQPQLSTLSAIPMTSTTDPAMSSSQLPQSLSTSGAISMASTTDPAMSSFSSLSQLFPTSSLTPMSFTSNPAMSSFSPLPQLLPTSSTPLPTRSPAQRNVGAIVAGTVVGAFVGIIALIVLANVAVLLYRRCRDDEAYENIPPQAPRSPPPAVPAKDDAEAAPPGPVEMTQVPIPGDESRIYRPIQSNNIPFEIIPETRSAATRPSSIQGVTVPVPAMRRSMHAPRSRPHSQAETSTRCQLLLSSDPFANVGRPISADAVEDRHQRQRQQQYQLQQHQPQPQFQQHQPQPQFQPQQHQPQSQFQLQQQFQQHNWQRPPSIRRSRHRQSRTDSGTASMIPETHPAIPEQDIEFIAQEVSSLIMTDPVPADRPTSHDSYSSPSIGQRSPTLGFARKKSPTINLRKSPALSYARPSAALKRSMSRGSSMEGG